MTSTNGYSRNPLRKLKRQARLAQAQAEVYKANAEVAVYESIYGIGGLGIGAGEMANPYGYRQDEFGGMWYPLGSGFIHARQHGHNRPFIWHDLDLDQMRSLARWLTAKNDLAIGAARTITNYTVKRGYKWEARVAKEYRQDPVAVKLVARVQRLIDDYSDLNNLASRERSACFRSIRDGEVFTRHFAQEDGTTILRFVEPEQVRPSPGSGTNCAYGIETDPEDVESVWAYHVTYDGVNYDRINPAEVCHYKRNVDECVKRGLSDFFSSGDTFDQVAKLLRNMTISGGVQAAIAWIEQHDGATSSQVQSHIANIKDLNRPSIENPITGRTPDYQQMGPGTVVKTGKSKEYIPAPLAGNTTQHTNIVQAALRSIGCRWNMPEYMISGDSSNANYSSTLVSGSPFVNAIECGQDDFGRLFLRWRWIAIRNACDAGLFGEIAFSDIMRMVDLHFTPPLVAVAKEAEQATIDHQDIAAGVMSLQTRRARRGLDDEQEVRNLKLEPLTRAQGRFTDIDPAGNPSAAPAAGQQQKPPQEGKPASPMAGLFESRQEGERWQGQSGRWFTVKQGRTVPAAPSEVEGNRTSQPVGKIDTGAKDSNKPREGVLGAAIDRLGGVVKVSKEVAGRVGQSVWDSLPEHEQMVLAGAYAVGKWVLRRAETLLVKGKQMAREAAKERGLSDDQVERVARLIGIADAIASWTVNVPAVTLATGNVGLGKVAGLMPVASMAYLAYSTARNPLAVLRAAKTALTNKANHESILIEEAARMMRTNKANHESILIEKADQESVRLLVDAIADAADPDWYSALLLVALDKTQGNLSGAIAQANAAIAATPAPIAESKDASGHEHDEKGLFTGPGEGGSAAGEVGKDSDKADKVDGKASGTAGKDPSAATATDATSAADATDDKPAAEVDPAANRPSRPEERRKNEDGSVPLPVVQQWKAPPPKQGKKGGGKPVRTKGEDSQSRVGDISEAQAIAIGFRSILPEGQRSHKPGENKKKGSTIDLEYDHSGHGYELKTCNNTSTEYRLKAKKKEKDGKKLFAKLHSLTPRTLIGVREVETGIVHFYALKKYGFFGSEVSEKKFDYLGSVDSAGKKL